MLGGVGVGSNPGRTFFLVLLPLSDGIVRLGVCECFIS